MIDPFAPKPTPPTPATPTEAQLIAASLHTIASVTANDAVTARNNYLAIQRAVWSRGEEFGMKVITALAVKATAEPLKYPTPTVLQEMAQVRKAEINRFIAPDSPGKIVDDVVSAIITMPG